MAIMQRLKHLVKEIPVVRQIAGACLREYQSILSRFPDNGPLPTFGVDCSLLIERYGAESEFLARNGLGRMLETTRLESSLVPESLRPFQLDGFCAICSKHVNFFCDFHFAREVEGTKLPSWRETMLCSGCGLRNKMRGCLHVFLADLKPGPVADIYITEQLTPTYRWLRGRFKNVTGSEFIASKMKPGRIRRGIRHEDIQKTSFKGSSFDFVLSFEVLEHVIDFRAALSEVFRILKPGGKFFFTAPTNVELSQSLVRAHVDATGTIQHLLEPEYHGNPMDPGGGALCFRHFGWDLLDSLRSVGFEDPEFLMWWSRELGYLQYPQLVIVATRPNYVS